MKRFSYVSMMLYVMIVIGMLIGTNVCAKDSTVQVTSDRSVTKMGFDWMYAKDAWVPEMWQSPSCENTVNRFSFRYETNTILPASWYKWRVGGEIQYSMHKADELPDGSYWHIHKDGSHNSHDAGFREYSFNLTIARDMFDKMFYLKWVMGLSYWHERDHGMHNLGGSHCLGTWGPAIGKDWHIYKAWSLRTEVRGTHTSDPFQSDRGKNYLGWVIGTTYEF